MMELDGGNPFWASLRSAAKAALVAKDLDKARYFAEVMVNGDESGWSYESNLHYGNITLGRIALAEGDVKQARSYLLRAGAVPGSRYLELVGPDTALAK